MKIYDVLSSGSIKQGKTFDDSDVQTYTVTANVLEGHDGPIVSYNCTCKGFTYRQTCKHVALVRKIDSGVIQSDPSVRLRESGQTQQFAGFSSFGAIKLDELF